MPRKKRRNILDLNKTPSPSEAHLPDENTEWLNKEKSGDPSDHAGVPTQLKDMSEMDAIAWVLKNCKFAAK